MPIKGYSAPYEPGFERIRKRADGTHSNRCSPLALLTGRHAPRTLRRPTQVPPLARTGAGGAADWAGCGPQQGSTSLPEVAAPRSLASQTAAGAPYAPRARPGPSAGAYGRSRGGGLPWLRARGAESLCVEWLPNWRSGLSGHWALRPLLRRLSLTGHPKGPFPAWCSAPARPPSPVLYGEVRLKMSQLVA